MRQADDVFFFTLIDFLIQVFFFGLLLYVVAQASQMEKDIQHGAETRQIEDLKKVAGVSNLTELTDYLTKLAPVKELKGVADFISRAGGLQKAKEVTKFVADAGGTEKVKERLDKLSKYEEGTGKPPCIFDIVKDRKVTKLLATVIAGDSSIRFLSSTPQLEEVLRRLGLRYDRVRELPLQEFKRTFEPLVKVQEQCRYTLRFLETTRFVDARDAARSTFYLNIGKP